ncbi:MAG: hypothetical protein E7275_00395 [Pseudobutyrivibrio sp.]|uniref:hypothetical protein n=1 Tax=Pseudobutyrivibrio sp. TaxID=2014367 RepID=UPI0025FF3AE1|nr:hypothetical protein [Pseudobutyrivibrio sp.]MBE5902718.1 hypothetical protein [Pseudobutyrivibrio sp.]
MPTSISDLTSGNNPLYERKRLAKQFLDIATFYKDLGTDKDYNAIKSYLEREIERCNYLQSKGIPYDRNIKNNQDLRNATLEYLGRTVIDNANIVSKEIVKDLNTVRGEKYYSKNLKKAKAKRNKIRKNNKGLNNPIIPENKNQMDALSSLDDRRPQENRNPNISSDGFISKEQYKHMLDIFRERHFNKNNNNNRQNYRPIKNSRQNYNHAQGQPQQPNQNETITINYNLGPGQAMIINLPTNRQNVPQISGGRQLMHPQSWNNNIANKNHIAQSPNVNQQHANFSFSFTQININVNGVQISQFNIPGNVTVVPILAYQQQPIQMMPMQDYLSNLQRNNAFIGNQDRDNQPSMSNSSNMMQGQNNSSTHQPMRQPGENIPHSTTALPHDTVMNQLQRQRTVIPRKPSIPIQKSSLNLGHQQQGQTPAQFDKEYLNQRFNTIAQHMERNQQSMQQGINRKPTTSLPHEEVNSQNKQQSHSQRTVKPRKPSMPVRLSKDAPARPIRVNSKTQFQSTNISAIDKKGKGIDKGDNANSQNSVENEPTTQPKYFTNPDGPSTSDSVNIYDKKTNNTINIDKKIKNTNNKTMTRNQSMKLK